MLDHHYFFQHLGFGPVEVRFLKHFLYSIFPPWRVNVLGVFRMKSCYEISRMRIILTNIFFCYFSMVLVFVIENRQFNNEDGKTPPPPAFRVISLKSHVHNVYNQSQRHSLESWRQSLRYWKASTGAMEGLIGDLKVHVGPSKVCPWSVPAALSCKG
jgi:hypothetical protein